MKTVRPFRASRALLLVVVALVAFAGASSAQTDPAVGTWTLNVAKSKYDPGPAPKSNTVTIEAAGQGSKVTAKGVDAAGAPTGTQYTATYDGKDSPVMLTGSQDYDAIALTRVNATTVEGSRKKGGKVVQSYRREVSKDGKTMTITTKGTNAKGQQVNNVVVFDKK